jgi:septum site-determining protein MinC
MSAVVCSDVNTSCLELKSAALTLMALVLKTTDLAQLADELSQRASAMPGLFDDEPVVVDLSFVRETAEPIDFDVLVVLLMQYGMRPVAVRGGMPEQMSAALASGLLEAPEGARPLLREVPAPDVVERIVEKIVEVPVEVTVEVPVEVQLAAPPPLVIDKPLRSGQQVYAQGRDLIVLALVSYGAEVIADGDIHIYAPLRGRAHAGKSGNTKARIYCHCMEAQVLAIAGVYRTADVALPDAVVGHAAMVRLDGGQLAVERLG